jgi:hypothetical protein
MSTDHAPRMLASALALGLTLASSTLTGCPGTLDLGPYHLADDGGAETAAACPDVPTQILAPSCGKAGCHLGASAAGGVDLSVAGISTLPGKSDPSCGGLIVDPAHAEKSALYLKLGPNPPCGGRMPQGAPALSDSDQQCVLAWIRTLPAAAADAGAD